MWRTRLAAVALAGGVLAVGLPGTVLGADAPAAAASKQDRSRQPTRPARESAPPQRSSDQARQQEQARQRQVEQQRAAEQARQREAQQRAAEEAKRRAEEQQRARAAEQARQRQVEQQRAAEQARQREAQQRAAEDAKRRAEEQQRARAAEEARQRQVEQQRAAEQARQREAQQRAAEDAKRRAEQASPPSRDPISRPADEARNRVLDQQRASDLARQREAQQRAAEQQRAADEAKRRAEEQQARQRQLDQQRASDEARRRLNDPVVAPRTEPSPRNLPPTRVEGGDRTAPPGGDPIVRDRTPVRTPPSSVKEPTLAERIRELERQQAQDRLRTPAASKDPAAGAPPSTGRPPATVAPPSEGRDPVTGVTPPRGAPQAPRTGGDDPAGGGRIVITPGRGSTTDRDPTRGGPGADLPGRGDVKPSDPVTRDPISRPPSTGGPATRDPMTREPAAGGSTGRTPITGAPTTRDPIASRNPVELPRTPASGPTGGGRSPIVDDRNPVRGGPSVGLPSGGMSRDPVVPGLGKDPVHPARRIDRDDWQGGRDWRDDRFHKDPIYAPIRRADWWRNDCLDDDSWRWRHRSVYHSHVWYGHRDWCDPWRDYDWFCRSSSSWSFRFSWGGHGSWWSIGYRSGSWCPPSYGTYVAWRIHRPSYLVSTWCAPAWYDHYCDWYYGPWYRPYTHVTKIVYETNYYTAPSTFVSSSGSPGVSQYASGTWDGGFSSPAVYEAPPAVAAQATLDGAWELLEGGFLVEAREAFVEVGSLFPFEGGPQIGYAIAAGLLGDRDASIHAMRKALRDEPGSLSRVPASLAMQVHVRSLLDRHALDLREGRADRDTLFMLASLRYLANEHEAAYFAINEAIDQGDQDPSTLALKELLRGALFDRLYR